MLPACKQQSQFCCQHNFYLEQTEVLFQEFPRLLRHAMRWHCTMQPGEGRHKNISCCLVHPEGDYSETLTYFQEETDSAEPAFQKLPVLTAGEYGIINTSSAIAKRE